MTEQAFEAGAPELVLRESRAEDFVDIRSIETLAFRRPDEADLVENLRSSGQVLVELVAEERGEIVGHILFSAAEASPAHFKLAILAPVAVRPDAQGQGIGGHLIRRGLRALKSAGHDLCVVVGHPEFYPQFGFDHELALRISGPWSRAGRAWMALPLSDVGRRCGLISISVPSPFDDID